MGAIRHSRRADPVLFMQDCGFVPDPFQEKVLRSKSRRILLCCGRQMGKSTVVAVKALHQALCSENSLILIASRVEQQAEELFIKIKSVYDTIGRPVEARCLRFSLELSNGSRIMALPGDPNNIVGFSAPRLVILDEASRVHEGMLEAVSPMLAVSGGTLLMCSTPFGRRGFFFREWDSGLDYERIAAKASECPRITPEFLDHERHSLGEQLYLQNYEIEFLASDQQIFSLQSINNAFSTDVQILPGF